jgi:signal transduction histidine kinase
MTLVGLLLVPLLALLGLWGFLASITLGNAITEHNFNRTVTTTIRANNALLGAVGQERLKTFLWLSTPRQAPVSQLAAARQADDAAVAAYKASFAQSQSALPASYRQAQQALIAELARLPAIRAAADSRKLSATGAFEAYNNLLNTAFGAYISGSNNDVTVYRETLAVIDADRGIDQLSREMTLMAGAALQRGQMSPTDRVLFTDAVANQHSVIGDAIALSNGQLRTSLQRLYSSPAHQQLAALESQISGSTGGQAPVQGVLRTWGPASQAFMGQLTALQVHEAAPLAALAGHVGNKLFLEAALAGGLGLLAVAVSVFLMIRFGRSIRRELTSLLAGAQTMASERLPRVIERLRNGGEVDVAAESPPLPTGKITEVAQVADAFSTVQRTAVNAAVDQANLRKGVNQVFLNLSLRNQSLLHRQLGMLDTMERATNDPAALADLFRLDHLTTRMRRHAEGLIILSGATPGRGWRDPVPVLDVLRAAIAEVEDYTRVEVASESPDSVVGTAVNDVIHLIAELVENATTFSPPNTRVEIRADTVGIGFAVEIEDRGLGLTPEELAEINARLASPPEFDLANSDQLGLFVVGQLAARHGIRISLRESPFGGTTAIVLLPRSIIVREGEAGPSVSSPTAQSAAAPVNGVSHPGGTEDPVADRERASAFGLTGRHRLGANPPPARSGPETASPAANGSSANGSNGSSANGGSGDGGSGDGGSPRGSAASADGWSAVNGGQTDPWQLPARPEPSQQRPPWDTPALEATPEPATAPQASMDQAKRSVAGGTHRGLPRRVRQANLAPQLRNGTAPAPHAAQASADPIGRSPEETRSMMASLQDGWQRGRLDELDNPDDELADWPGGRPGAAPDENDGEAS